MAKRKSDIDKAIDSLDAEIAALTTARDRLKLHRDKAPQRKVRTKTPLITTLAKDLEDRKPA